MMKMIKYFLVFILIGSVVGEEVNEIHEEVQLDDEVDYDVNTTAEIKPYYETFTSVNEQTNGNYTDEDSKNSTCQFHYMEYEKKFLRGAQDKNHVVYNNTKNFKKCAERCCYETGFECKSFSYFKTLQLCFVMNVVQYSEDVELEDSEGFDYFELITPTTAAPKTTPHKYLNIHFSSNPSKRTPITKETKLSDPRVGSIVGNPDCPLTCNNGGTCAKKSVDNMEDQPYCECVNGFEGEKCEKKKTVPKNEGFPVWLIAVIVIGGILLFLLIFICILCNSYKKKSGEYRVVGALRDWARSGRLPKHAASTEDFMKADESFVNPTMSVYSIQQSNTGTRSTSTHV